MWKDICDPSSDLGIVDLDYTEIDEIFCKNQVGANSKNLEMFSTFALRMIIFV